MIYVTIWRTSSAVVSGRSRYDAAALMCEYLVETVLDAMALLTQLSTQPVSDDLATINGIAPPPDMGHIAMACITGEKGGAVGTAWADCAPAAAQQLFAELL